MPIPYTKKINCPALVNSANPNTKKANARCKKRETISAPIPKLILHIKAIFTFIAVIFACAGILLMPYASKSGVQKGLTLCSEILIPSLFPFMVISSFIVKSGIALKISNFAKNITKSLFNLPGCTGATILLGFIGGYPIGARGVKSLLEEGLITEGQGNRMLYFVFGSGPVFVINVIGTQLLGNTQIGLIIFISQTISSVLIGIITRFFKDKPSQNVSGKPLFESSVKNNFNTSKALVESCVDSIYGMLNLCSFVILFSCLLSILNGCGFSNFVSDILIDSGISAKIASSFLPFLMEITVGSFYASSAGVPAEIIAFALCWAGLSVHFQISSIMSDTNFSKLRFTLFRIINGVSTAIFTHLGLIIFPISKAAFFSTTQSVDTSLYLKTPGCLSLIILCSFFLMSLGIEDRNYNQSHLNSKN